MISSRLITIATVTLILREMVISFHGYFRLLQIAAWYFYSKGSANLVFLETG